MRRLSLLLIVLVVIPLFGSDSPKEYDDKTEAAGIEGTWRLTEYELDGAKHEPNFRCVLTLRNGTFTVNYSNDEDTIRGSYRLDTTRKLPHLDWLPSNGSSKGQMLKFIYQIDRDTLRTAIMNADGTRPPQGFSDKGVVVHNYKHVK